MKSGAHIVRDNFAAVMAQVSALHKGAVLVGIPADETAREQGDPITNAALGYIHENGAPAANIPARPWLVPGIKNAQDKITQRLGAAMRAALLQDAAARDKQLHAAGIVAASAAKAMINSNIAPALSDATLAARRARGVTRENTLIDTGQFRNAVTYVVREG